MRYDKIQTEFIFGSNYMVKTPSREEWTNNRVTVDLMTMLFVLLMANGIRDLPDPVSIIWQCQNWLLIPTYTSYRYLLYDNISCTDRACFHYQWLVHATTPYFMLNKLVVGYWLLILHNIALSWIFYCTWAITAQKEHVFNTSGLLLSLMTMTSAIFILKIVHQN